MMKIYIAHGLGPIKKLLLKPQVCELFKIFYLIFTTTLNQKPDIYEKTQLYLKMFFDVTSLRSQLEYVIIRAAKLLYF